MNTTSARYQIRELPAKAQNPTGVFAFLFNLIGLIVEFLNLIDLFESIFGGGQA